MRVPNPPLDEPFPLQQGGGSFLACMGAALVVGSFNPSHAGMLLGFGAIAGLASIVSVRVWRRRMGMARPRARQIWLLLGAIALEFVAFGMIFPHVHDDIRLRWFASLAIVAAHFLLMAWTFGPPIVMLAFTLGLWLVAAYLAPHVPLGVVMGIDGTIKLAFGWAMFTGVFARLALRRAS